MLVTVVVPVLLSVPLTVVLLFDLIVVWGSMDRDY